MFRRFVRFLLVRPRLWSWLQTAVAFVLTVLIYIDQETWQKPETASSSFLSHLLRIAHAIDSKIVLTFAIVALGVTALERYSDWASQPSKKAIAEQTRRIERFSEGINVIFESFITNVGSQLGFGTHGRSRATLYIHDSEKRQFFICGRFSYNPVLKKIRRTWFKDTQGCIAEAWTNDWHFDNSFPAGQREFISYNASRYKIPRNELRKLRMCPHLIAAKRLSAGPNDAIGVLVVESVDANSFTEEDLKDRMFRIEEQLSPLINELKSYIPNPDEARERGL